MLLGTMLAVLDSSILNISTVSMLQEFRVGLSTVEWMLTSYNLVFAAFMIGLGGLGDAVGRRRLYVLGQIVFTIGSGLAAVTALPWQVITARALQGLGAAAPAPNALALILEHFPEDERGSALGIWGAAAGLGGALGPTVGGGRGAGVGMARSVPRQPAAGRASVRQPPTRSSLPTGEDAGKASIFGGSSP